ncbi:hypothetical protein BDV37DRAFT_242463 [Aspergillus pseudonomiae]|uniref:Cyanovirin-N domain-containing protein n=1 Tax=Aspergillus pseudonomiae TaxID=1506151 RepID=A0A5N7DL86_9EURO|nr:uncharacterized protein BDV37DRAFT_242463 [Aspergillus pseudonomiae]KAE8406743.1 hypothetical protein BDV37DRAFT_242463 [Aspergillus pseudonomiae]
MMSDRPFNETARHLQLDEFVNEDDPCILRGELKNDDGEWIPAEINLNEVFSAYDRSCTAIFLRHLFPSVLTVANSPA